MSDYYIAAKLIDSDHYMTIDLVATTYEEAETEYLATKEDAEKTWPQDILDNIAYWRFMSRVARH